MPHDLSPQEPTNPLGVPKPPTLDDLVELPIAVCILHPNMQQELRVQFGVAKICLVNSGLITPAFEQGVKEFKQNVEIAVNQMIIEWKKAYAAEQSKVNGSIIHPGG